MSILARFPSKYLKGQTSQPGMLSRLKKFVTNLLGLNRTPSPSSTFANTPKGVVLNVTNTKSVAKDLGEDETKWTGQRLC